MKMFATISLILFFLSVGLAQTKDYLDFRPNLFRGNKCATEDHLNNAWRLVEIAKLDTNIYRKNIEYYYLDLANWNYEYGYVNNIDKHENFLEASRKALFHDPDNYHALHNLAHGYARIRECAEAKKYWELYLKHVPLYYDEILEMDIKEYCRD